MTTGVMLAPVRPDDAPASSPARAARPMDRWVAAIFAANVVQALAFARLYPQQRFDPDLLAYLVYFRNWLDHDTSLYGVTYFMHPKALLVFALGPLADVSAAFYCTTIASAVLGSLVYLISRDHFGRLTALLVSAFLLLDPSKAMLTLKSSADLYVALFLFASIWLCDRGRLLPAAVSLLLSALVKPVTLPCAAYFLTVENGGRRRWLAAAIPLLAAPLTLWSNHALLGSAHATDHFFAEFTALRGGESVGPDSVLYFALWTQLVKQRFAATAAWGVIGVLIWLAGDRRHLTAPLLLMPLLFLSGYFALSLVSPFMPFYRFFWPLEIWFLMFLVYGVVEGARRLAGAQRWVPVAVGAFALWLLADAYIVRQFDYRRDVALVFENGMAFATAAEPVLRAQRDDGDSVLAPLALLPYLMWQFPDAGREHRIETAERGAINHPAANPDWILYVPRLSASDAARTWLPELIRTGGYDVRYSDGEAELLAGPQVRHRAPQAASAGPAIAPVARP
jgi:hypothetical protein